MTLEELKAVLDNTKLQVSYSSVPIEEAAKPYIVYWQTGVRNFAADGVAYYSRKLVTISLYTDNRDRTSEGLIEAELTKANIYWSKTTDFLDSEKIFETIYTIEV